MKKILYFLIILVLFSLTYYYKEDIYVLYNKYFTEVKEPSTLEKNEYYRNYDFKYVSNTTNFSPNNKQDILNIYYTIINSGMEDFTFYCKDEYENCLNDVKDTANNQTVMSNINNFVHPYNGFKDLLIEIDSLGKVNIHINKNYSNEMIAVLNYKIDEIIKENISSNMTDKEKIKVIHDYIINNTKYDKDRSDNNIVNYSSDTAYGALIEGYALCGGYTDSMMLFLEKLNIKSYRISTSNHVWNRVYLNNNWYNLDLTWDDPINSNGTDSLKYTFFLVNDEEMLENDKEEHQHEYDKSVYSN